MSAIDTLSKIEGCDIRSLPALQRVLLITDGTLTDILEAVFLERIQIVKVAQRAIPATAEHSPLEAKPGEILIQRSILLRGHQSRRNYAYAESLIAADRLGPTFRKELFDSDLPLGRLWVEHQLETYKELQEVRCVKASRLADGFPSVDCSALLVRTYRVMVQGRPSIMITEHFPARYTAAPVHAALELTSDA